MLEGHLSQIEKRFGRRGKGITREQRKAEREQRSIVCAVEEARQEWDRAVEYFNHIEDPNLIEYAIYKMSATEAKYTYFLNLAKKSGITLEL